MKHPAIILATHTWLEAWNARLPSMLVVLVALGAGLQWFVNAVTMIEHTDAALAIAAPVLRLGVIIMLAAMITSQIGREFGERRIEMLLAAPISRLTWVLGRFLGAAMISAACAISAGAALAWQAPPAAVAAWTFTFWLELLLVGTLAITVTVALKRPAMSLLAVMLLYVAGRVIAVIDRLAQSGISELASGGMAEVLTGLLARLLPQTALFAPTNWLLTAELPAAMGWGIAQAAGQYAIYFVLLLLVCQLDLSNDLD